MGRKVGEHDFVMPILGTPAWFDTPTRWKTFSVGVFCWVEAANGGLKKGAAKVRIIGRTNSTGHKLVHAKALEVANALDAGTYAGPKRVHTDT